MYSPDITEILLKVALNTTNQTKPKPSLHQLVHSLSPYYTSYSYHVPNKGVPNPNSVGAGATGGTNAGTAGGLLYHKKTNTLFKTITGTAGGLLYYKKN